jgi:hypothetical protein
VKPRIPVFNQNIKKTFYNTTTFLTHKIDKYNDKSVVPTMQPENKAIVSIVQPENKAIVPIVQPENKAIVETEQQSKNDINLTSQNDTSLTENKNETKTSNKNDTSINKHDDWIDIGIPIGIGLLISLVGIMIIFMIDPILGIVYFLIFIL